MLVHYFVNHTQPLAPPNELALVITLAVFGTLPDPEEDCPFMRLMYSVCKGKEQVCTTSDKTKAEEKAKEVNGSLSPYFFCYQNQFTIEFKECYNRYEFKPNWHCLREDAREKERALVALHPHLFKYEGQTNGY